MIPADIRESVVVHRTPRQRLTGILAPVLAVLALLAWVFASPIGASPDDDYHLTSTWCASTGAGEWCAAPAGAEPGERAVPEALARIACYAFDSNESAACQGEEFSWDLGQTVETRRSNVGGGYPPVFYAINGLLASADVQTSALLMRTLSVAIFLGFGAALWALLPVHRRPVLVWGWLISSVPLGLFLVTSNNPSAWAIIGVGTGWLALLGYVESTDRSAHDRSRCGLRPRGSARRGSPRRCRSLRRARDRGGRRAHLGAHPPLVAPAILPTVVALGAVAFFLTSRQSQSGLQGFGGSPSTGGGPEALSGPSLLAYNILNLPSLWAGMLTEGGLGWLDTPMPSIVAYAGVGVFLVMAFAGLFRLSRRKGIALALIGAVLVVLPLYVLQAGGDRVGRAGAAALPAPADRAARRAARAADDARATDRGDEAPGLARRGRARGRRTSSRCT